MTGVADLAVVLGAVDPPGGGLLGLEHEYRLRADGESLDFRDLIHGLAVPGRRLDPGDTNAYRCASGLALTADDEDAEVASPPLPLTPNFTENLYDWAAAGRSLLDHLLPASVAVDGYSTHLSASVPDGDLDAVVDLFAATFAPAVMVMVDRMSSHGVFVRPRPSRLELCAEYVTGERLRAGAAFFAGGARACALAVGRGTSEALPPPLAVRPLVALGRCGLELDRKVTFGFDLYSEGRAARLPLREGGAISAQRYLEEAWRSARSALAAHVCVGDLVAAERVVAGARPLGIEANGDHDISTARPLPPSPFGALLTPRERSGFVVEAVLATWDFTVFSLRGAERTAYACVPRTHLARFLAALDAGELDNILEGFVRTPSAGRTLSAFAQTQNPGLWDEVGAPTDLVPPERTPGSASSESHGETKAARAPFAPSAPGAGAAPQGTGVSGAPTEEAFGTGIGGARPGKPSAVGRRRRAPGVVTGGARPPGAPTGAAGEPPSGQPVAAVPGAGTQREVAGGRYGKPPVAGLARRSAPQFAVPPPPPPPPREPSGPSGRGHRRRRAMVVVVVALVVLAGVALALVLTGGSEKRGHTTSTSTSAVPETTTPTSEAPATPPETHGAATRFSTSARTTVPVTRGTIPATTTPPPVTTRVPPTAPPPTPIVTTAPPPTTLRP